MLDCSEHFCGQTSYLHDFTFFQLRAPKLLQCTKQKHSFQFKSFKHSKELVHRRNNKNIRKFVIIVWRIIIPWEFCPLVWTKISKFKMTDPFLAEDRKANIEIHVSSCHILSSLLREDEEDGNEKVHLGLEGRIGFSFILL